MERSTVPMTESERTERHEIDRILSRKYKDEILPSSGFAASVMDAVRREASAPPPIPFPWRRALPGLIVGALALALLLVAGVFALLQLRSASSAVSLTVPPILTSALQPSSLQQNLGSAAAWTLLSLLLAFVSVKLSLRLASGKA